MNEFELFANCDVLSVVGPTASGKTALAIALAEQLDGEIINADSVQVYRHFDIGSGKPNDAELTRVPHHLIGVVDPLDDMDAARFADTADRHIAEIRARGRLPIVCGGTFLWTRALLFGLAPAPPGSPELREEHRRIAETEGRSALHTQLQAVDSVSAERLSPNDLVRVSRALEVFQLTGKPLSEYQAEHGFRTPRYRSHLLGIRFDADALSLRIRQRTQHMFEAGWLEEVQALIDAGFGDARAMRAVGYRQLYEALRAVAEPDAAEPNRDELLEAVVRATRVFARRQRTWLRDEAATWLSPEQASLIVSGSHPVRR